MLDENRLQGPVDRKRHSTAGYPRDTDQRTQRERDIHTPQIIPARASYRHELSVSFPPLKCSTSVIRIHIAQARRFFRLKALIKH